MLNYVLSGIFKKLSIIKNLFIGKIKKQFDNLDLF